MSVTNLTKKHAETTTVPVNVLSVFDCAKEYHSSKGVTKEQQEHAHYDEEALVHAHHHRQQKHLQGHLHIHKYVYTLNTYTAKRLFHKMNRSH